MIAGVNDGSENNGPQLVTAGQDLYTIYSNNVPPLLKMEKIL